VIAPSSVRDRESGFALLAVLWVVVVLGALAGTLAAEGRIDAGATFHERCRLAGHYAALAGLADVEERLYAGSAATVDARAGFLVVVPDGRPDREVGEVMRLADEMGDARYQVVAVDLNSRLDVNRADEPALEHLLEAGGVPVDRANALADAVLDWIDADDLHRARGAESDDYARLYLDQRPRNGPLPSLDELLLVRGMTPEILYGDRGATPGRFAPRTARGVARWLTVEGTGRINLNTAPPEVLGSLPGFEPDVVAIVLDQRRSGPIASLSNVAADPRLAGGPMRLQSVAMQLIRMTTAHSEGVEVRAIGETAGCPVAARIDAVLQVDGTGRIAVAGWHEAMESGEEDGEDR
jgi:general secretion pathway protein K